MYRGFSYLKKLFNIGPSILIDDFSSLRITGPYALVSLGPNFATIKCDNYTVETTGENLIVDKLLEEVAVFSFSSITKIEVSKQKDDGTIYES